jgi:translation initiation factor 3 subunit M
VSCAALACSTRPTEKLSSEVEGFFNLLFAHLFNLFPIDSDEIEEHVETLLSAITSSKGRFSSQHRL